MRKMKLKVKLLLGYLAGIESGLMLSFGISICVQRPGWPGGEVLIIPLIVLLLWFGVQLGVMGRSIQEYNRGYKEGYSDGNYDGTIEVHPINIEIMDADYKPIS